MEQRYTWLTVNEAYNAIMEGERLTTSVDFYGFPSFHKNKFGGIDKSWPEDVEETWKTKEEFLKSNDGDEFRKVHSNENN